MRNAVIIGAGQTGRGYVARFLFEKGINIHFIDQNKDLIDLLSADKAYSIHFYSKDRKPLYINGFEASLAYSDEANKAIKEADFIFTAVAEQNLGDVAKQLKEGLKGKQGETVLLTCENGINPGRVLSNHLKELEVSEKYVVSMTAVFCSTVVLEKTRLDILSMNEYYFPYDADAIKELEFEGAVPIHNFEKFLKRKIYTYNCLAGLISYCGYVKGYEVYGEAANDPDISLLMDRLLVDLNPALQAYFEITKEDQEEFAERAMKKMKDLDILDFTIKNGRAAKRKLGPTERIMSPLLILKDHNKDYRIMEFVAAAALIYWEERQGLLDEPMLEVDPIKAFCQLNSLDLKDKISIHVYNYYQAIKNNRDRVDINSILNEVQYE